jgi:hypothetical protein
MRGRNTSTARGQASSRRGDSPIVLEIAGFYPIFTSALVVVCSGRSSVSPERQSGGDEETRTPDPLLAKEMLSQLSYVPRRPSPAGRWWAFLDSNQRPLPYQGSALTS